MTHKDGNQGVLCLPDWPETGGLQAACSNTELLSGDPVCIQVIVRNLSSEEVSVFTYEDWLSRMRGPKRTLICEMAAVVDEEVMVELTTYVVQVKTSDNAGEFLSLRPRTSIRIPYF